MVRLGSDPLSKEERRHLAERSKPVADKYAAWLLDTPEALLLVAVSMVYGPRMLTVYQAYKAKKPRTPIEAKKAEEKKKEENPAPPAETGLPSGAQAVA